MKNTKNTKAIILPIILICATITAVPFTDDKVSAMSPFITRLINVNNNGAQANNSSSGPISISADGRYVAFSSGASNLVSGDTNGFSDIFVRDLVDGTTARVNVSSYGIQANKSGSVISKISNDGRYVAFISDASNLVANDNNSSSDVFIHDRQAGQTELISATPTEESGGGVSGVDSIDMSGDGRYVVFSSTASDLTAGDTNGYEDIFVKDREFNTMTRLNISSSGQQANSTSRYPTISCDGTLVAFSSWASNLVSDDVNGMQDMFLLNRQRDNSLHNVTLAGNGDSSGGSSSTPSISCEGKAIVFASTASNLVINDNNNRQDIFVYDIAYSFIERVNVTSRGNETGSRIGAYTVSSDGRYIGFESEATNLVTDDTNAVEDIFLRDRKNESTQRISMISATQQTSRPSYSPTISPDGRSVGYVSDDQNVASGDTNNVNDIFLYQQLDTQPPLISGKPDRLANSSNWYNDDVTIDWYSSDPTPSSGTPSDPPITVAFVEGKDINYISELSCDPHNNCATGAISISIDKTRPTVGEPALNAHPVHRRRGAQIWANATDALSGIGGGEYFIDNDPGEGNGVPMSVDGSVITGSISNLNIAYGRHYIGVRVRDNAGNWSAPSYQQLVYVP